MTASGLATPECPPVCWETADSPVGDGSRSRLGTASPWQPQAPPHLIGGQVLLVAPPVGDAEDPPCPLVRQLTGPPGRFECVQFLDPGCLFGLGQLLR